MFAVNWGKEEATSLEFTEYAPPTFLTHTKQTTPPYSFSLAIPAANYYFLSVHAINLLLQRDFECLACALPFSILDKLYTSFSRDRHASSSFQYHYTTIPSQGRRKTWPTKAKKLPVLHLVTCDADDQRIMIA